MDFKTDFFDYFWRIFWFKYWQSSLTEFWATIVLKTDISLDSCGEKMHFSMIYVIEILNCNYFHFDGNPVDFISFKKFFFQNIVTFSPTPNIYYSSTNYSELHFPHFIKKIFSLSNWFNCKKNLQKRNIFFRFFPFIFMIQKSSWNFIYRDSPFSCFTYFFRYIKLNFIFLSFFCGKIKFCSTYGKI